MFDSSPGGDEKKPGFMAFSDALPGFLRPFASTNYPATPFPMGLTIDEAIDCAQSLFLEGMNYVHGVVVRSQARYVQYDTGYQKTRTALGLAKKHYQTLEEENKVLQKEISELRRCNQTLLRQAEESERSREVSLSMLRDLEKKTKGALEEKNEALQKFEASVCELENLKKLFSEKVSALEIACSSKEGVISHQAIGLQRVETLCAELGEQLEQVKKSCEAAKQEVLFHQQIAEQHSSDISWLLKQGMPQVFHSLLNSEEFGNMNGALQSAALQLGMLRGCQRTHQAYPDQLNNCSLVVQDVGLEEVLMGRFAELVSFEYAPVGSLVSGAMDLESLKKYLSADGGEFVGESGNGGTEVANDDDDGEKEVTGDNGGDGKVVGRSEDEVKENAGGDGNKAGDGKDDEGKMLEPDDVLV